MAKVKAYVYKIPGLIDGYKVYPPVVILNKGDKFQLVNTVDDHDAELTVPAGVFEDGVVNKEKIDKRSGSRELTAKDTIIGVQYKVKVDGKDATGHSDPVIIIDP
jgi:hypothetical protein